MIRTTECRQVVSPQRAVRSAQGEGVTNAGQGASGKRPATYLELTDYRAQTKHFQTLFWTPEVRLVDCPGLVMPNFVPMETQVRPSPHRPHRHLTSRAPTITDRAPGQVLSAILPISRVSAVPLCTHHAAQLLPLERILQLAHPALASPPPADRRTWREGMRPRAEAGAGTQVWTAMDVLTAYALRKGWVTAKAGRPDVNRAGNASKCLSPSPRWVFSRTAADDMGMEQSFVHWQKAAYVGLSGPRVRTRASCSSTKAMLKAPGYGSPT